MKRFHVLVVLAVVLGLILTPVAALAGGASPVASLSDVAGRDTQITVRPLNATVTAGANLDLFVSAVNANGPLPEDSYVVVDDNYENFLNASGAFTTSLPVTTTAGVYSGQVVVEELAASYTFTATAGDSLWKYWEQTSTPGVDWPTFRDANASIGPISAGKGITVNVLGPRQAFEYTVVADDPFSLEVVGPEKLVAGSVPTFVGTVVDKFGNASPFTTMVTATLAIGGEFTNTVAFDGSTFSISTSEAMTVADNYRYTVDVASDAAGMLMSTPGTISVVPGPAVRMDVPDAETEAGSGTYLFPSVVDAFGNNVLEGEVGHYSDSMKLSDGSTETYTRSSYTWNNGVDSVYVPRSKVVGKGSATLCFEGLCGTADITVTPAALASIQIVPSVLTAGASVTFTVALEGADEFGNAVVADVPVTLTVDGPGYDNSYSLPLSGTQDLTPSGEGEMNLTATASNGVTATVTIPVAAEAIAAPAAANTTSANAPAPFAVGYVPAATASFANGDSVKISDALSMRVNLRSSAELDGNVVEQAAPGQSLGVVVSSSVDGQWTSVQMADGVNVFVATALLAAAQ